MANSNRDVLTAICWAGATLLATASVENSVARALISGPFMFFVVGHMFLRAIGLSETGLLRQVVYGAAASIAICIAGGLLLHGIGQLTPLGWASYFATVTVLAAGVSVTRGGDEASTGILVQLRGRLPKVGGWQAAAFGAAVVMTAAAYSIDVRDEAAQQEFKYTEFWMRPVGSQRDEVVVGIKSVETSTRHFSVEIVLDHATVAFVREVELEPGGSWTKAFKLAVDNTQTHRAEAFLYETSKNVIYRKVSALLPAG